LDANQHLKASNPDAWDRFGASVAIDRNAAVVGAWGESSSATGIDGDQNDNSAHQAGAAYLFRKAGSAWRQDAYIKASNTWLDVFGETVAMFGNTVVVGASLEASDANGINGDQSDDSVIGAGASYVFVDQTLNLPQLINPGINDAWFNPQTNFQGFTIIIYPESSIMFLSWFTYDTERPPEDASANFGEPGHRWITAQGGFAESTAELTAYLSSGGVFDSPEPVVGPPEAIGTMTVTFTDCNSGIVSYDFPSLDLSGEIPIQRIATDNVVLCEAFLLE